MEKITVLLLLLLLLLPVTVWEPAPSGFGAKTIPGSARGRGGEGKARGVECLF